VPDITFKEFEMPDVGTPSLDQLQVFLTVVEVGSFAAAGRRLRRATSAVSYTIANLERQLGIALFDRERTRKPALTEAGALLLSKARAVSGGIDDLRASVKGLLSGLEAEVTLVVDVMFPTSRLADAVQGFEAEVPTVTLRLHVEALGAVPQLVHTGVELGEVIHFRGTHVEDFLMDPGLKPSGAAKQEPSVQSALDAPIIGGEVPTGRKLGAISARMV
jgi:DNA-binding transcriptional LysR family regulator